MWSFWDCRFSFRGFWVGGLVLSVGASSGGVGGCAKLYII